MGMSIPKKRSKTLSPEQKNKFNIYKDSYEGIVPRYQEPRPVEVPNEFSPKAKELLKQGKKVYFL